MYNLTKTSGNFCTIETIFDIISRFSNLSWATLLLYTIVLHKLNLQQYANFPQQVYTSIISI